MSQDSIFTKIIKGEIPAHKVYEDDLTIAFLDIHPIQPGHTLVVPKNPTEQLWDATDEDYRAVMATVKKLALKLKGVMATEHVGIEVVGVDIPHAHVHIVPFNTVGEFRTIPDMTKEPDHQALSELAKKIQIEEL